IEPSVTYANQYLDLTRKWVQQFKGSAPQPSVPPDASCASLNGHQLCGAFRDYWFSHGGLEQQGLPISDEFVEPSLTDAGKTYRVQYFERAIFEYHPENASTPYVVLLSQLGTARYQAKYPHGAPGQWANTDPTPTFFPQ